MAMSRINIMIFIIFFIFCLFVIMKDNEFLMEYLFKSGWVSDDC